MRFELAPFALPAEYAEGILPLEDAKAHCRVTHDSEDDLIAAFRDASVDMVERYCGVRLAVVSGLKWRAEGLPARVRLGVRPVLAVTGLSWLDSAGAEQSFDVEQLRVRFGDEVALAPGSAWPSGIGGGVEITFDAGFEDEERPAALVQAARMFCAHLYLNREAVVATGTIGGEIPLGVRALCSAYRMPVI